jgi:predicted transcriptional regulator
VPPSYAEGILKERIVNVLRQHPEGLTTQDISQLIGTHRHTATRYLAELKGAGITVHRPIGPAILHYLNSEYAKQVSDTLNDITNAKKLAAGGAEGR